MSGFIDFAEVKDRYSIADVVSQMLGIELSPVKGSDKLKGQCPFCNHPSAFKVTPTAGRDGKGLAGCFQCGKAGLDAIGMVAKVRGIDSQAAAAAIREHFGNGTVPSTVTVQSTVSKPRANSAAFNAEAYEKGLDREHEALAALTLNAETLIHFHAGYAKAGMNQGRLALAVHDAEGKIAFFCGLALKPNDSPAVKVPTGIDPANFIFNGHSVSEGDLYLAATPLQVLIAHQMGYSNVISVLTEGISSLQHQMIASLMDARKCLNSYPLTD